MARAIASAPPDEPKSIAKSPKRKIELVLNKERCQGQVVASERGT
jgi:hypothetical protein